MRELAAKNLRSSFPRVVYVTLAFLVLCVAAFAQTDGKADPKAKKEKKNEIPVTRLTIEVTAGESSKPVANASVYVRYGEGHTFLLHKHKEAELDLKTDQDGSVKVPEVPRGKVMIQIIAPGWHTFGQWYDLDKEEETIEIKLAEPHHWY